MNTIHGKIKLKLGIPEHGWLKMRLTCGTYELLDHISDVPNNPIDDLREVLSILVQYPRGMYQVEISLEPAYYYFEFEREESLFSILISFARNDSSKKEAVQKIYGNFDEIVMPIYRALMDFYSYKYTEPHWPPTSDKLVKKFKETIKSEQQNNRS
jgi:hypothetical protein